MSEPRYKMHVLHACSFLFFRFVRFQPFPFIGILKAHAASVVVGRGIVASQRNSAMHGK